MGKPELIWPRSILPNNSNIEQVIQVLNATSLKIVLITDSNGVLVGTISDGDIRRGLLKGLHLASPIDGVIYHDAFVVPPDLPRDMVVQLMLANKIQQIPIVDEQKRVIGLHLWEEIVSLPKRSNIMVIMAGGKGTRLYPQTKNCPKPLLHLAGKPILEHIIIRAKTEGFSHFVLAIHYLGHMIEDYFGNGERLGIKIEYLREEYPLGTAGALSLFNTTPPDTSIVVTNGDVITDISYGDLVDFHQKNNAQATMAIRMHQLQNPFGVVKTSGIEIIGYEEKPIHVQQINAGIYVLEPASLTLLTENEKIDMPNFFERIIKSGSSAIAYAIHENWMDLGTSEQLVKAQAIRLT
jgi:hypothetical protein